MTAVTPTQAGNRYLELYLRNHFVAAQGGLDLFHRASRGHSDPDVRRQLVQLAAEVAEDRAALLGILDDFAVPRSRLQERLASVAETLGRLKPNGAVLRRSPLSDVFELEALEAAVNAKRLGWVCLRHLAHHDDRLDPRQLETLVQRAQDQAERLGTLRLRTAERALVDADPGRGRP